MKKILYIFLVAASGLVYSQTGKKVPLVILDGAIAPSSWTSASVNKNILSATDLKGRMPESLSKFKAFSADRVIELKTAENYYDKISLATLNAQNKLPENSPVTVDGRKFTDTSIIILGEGLYSVKVKEVAGSKSLDISTDPASRKKPK